jgi:hypothetical protein
MQQKSTRDAGRQAHQRRRCNSLPGLPQEPGGHGGRTGKRGPHSSISSLCASTRSRPMALARYRAWSARV